MSIIISCQVVKGGCSKSAGIEHIATGLALRGKKVLCIDLDPQGNLTSNFGIYKQYSSKNIKSIFNVIFDTPIDKAILPVPDIYLSDIREREMYKDLAMQQFEFENSANEAQMKEIYGSDINVRIKKVKSDIQAQKEVDVLFPADAIQNNTARRFGKLDIIPINSSIKALNAWLTSQYSPKQANIQFGLKINELYEKYGENYYDYILIDTAVAQDTIQKNVLYASDYVLMPSDLDFAAEEGMALTYNEILKTKEEGIDVKILGILLQRVPNDLIKTVNLNSYLRIKEFASENNIYMFKNVIGEYKYFKPLRKCNCNAYNMRMVEAELLASGKRKNQLPNTMYKLSNQITYNYLTEINSKGKTTKKVSKELDFSQLGWDYLHLIDEIIEIVEKEGN